jgi:hypothetical protein
MRNLLALFGALVVTFLVVGYFLGWYDIQSVPGAPGHHKVNIDIHGTKIRQDLNQGREQVGDWINSKTQGSTEKQPEPKSSSSTNPNPSATPPAGGAVIVRPAPENTQIPTNWWIIPGK